VARIREDGKPELAYGHHRLRALLEEFGPDKEVALIIRDLDDDQMLKVMVRENGEDWGTSAVVDQESVRAVVLAYAEGRIQLTRPSSRVAKSTLRFAPSFTPGDGRGGSPDHPYTAPMLAEFMGWDVTRIKDTLRALALEAMGALRTKDFEDLSLAQARTVTTRAFQAYGAVEAGWKRRYEEVGTEEALRQAEKVHFAGREAARELGMKLAQEFREGTRGHSQPTVPDLPPLSVPPTVSHFLPLPGGVAPGE